jgi:pyruvate dehydrogenase E2 component (dihydrolipoamide acetyltransferase)
MPDFKLPDLGEGVTEAEIDRWLVKEGDTLGEDDPLVEVITDKASAEIPSPYAGLVTKIHVQAGDVVPVGTVLVTIGGTSAPAPAEDGEAVPARSKLEVGVRSEGRSASPPASRSESTGIKAMPPVRKLARELGVDLEQVTPSGPDGRIIREDVEAFADNVDGDAFVATPGSAGERREPYRGVRRLIGERMSHAHSVVPPVTHVEECDVTELDATRQLANDRNPDQPRLTFLPFIIKAVIQGLKDHPAVNASLDERAGEIIFHGRYDIGVAVDTPNGLTVPIIKNADQKRLRTIAAEIDRLAQGAREGTLKADDLRGGTFTVTSPGPFGGLMATPIVFHPQSAILGVHKATDRPVARNGQVVIRKIMNLSVTFDHRILDGMTAAKFVLDVVKLLEHPAVIALEA